MKTIDFEGLAAALLYRVRSLLPDWLPGGKLIGKEYACGDLSGGQGQSLRVNVETGRWADFAAGAKGGDLISLYAAIHNISQKEAAEKLEDQYGSKVNTKAQARTKPQSESLGPPPAGAPMPQFEINNYGMPSSYWAYRDREGDLLFYTARYDLPDGSKQFRPFSWNSKTHRWVNKLWPAPRPLFGLEFLNKMPDAPVLLVEGEKAAMAARRICGKTYVVLAWPGGSNAMKYIYFASIYGRRILLWPDADDAGRKAMIEVADLLYDHCEEIKILDIQDKPEGWDAADAEVEWKDYKDFFNFARPIAKLYEPVKKATTPTIPDEVNGYFVKGNDGRYKPLYRAMAKDLKAQGLWVFDGTGHHEYKDGVWEPISDEFLKNMICERNQKHILPTHIDSFAKIIKSFNYRGAVDFKETEGKVNLENGILDLESYTLEPHSKDYFFKWKIPVPYDPVTECPTWLQFLDTVFEGDKTLVDTAQRIFGYILMGGRPFLHRAFVLYGEGRNGKSVFLSILMKIIGEANFSTVSLSNLDKPFSAVMLDGKIANILEETPTDRINPEIFKAAVAGGYVQMSRKHMDEYSAKVNARFIFACNKLPTFGDNTTGNLDRLFFLPFNRYFAENERDVYMEDKIEKEITGVLNWAIEGLRLVKAEKRIEEPVPSLLLKEQYQQESDTVYAWMNDFLEINDTAQGVSTDDLYQHYFEQVRSGGQHPSSKINFARLLSKHGAKKAKMLGVSNFKCDRFYLNQVRTRGFLKCRIVKNENYDSLLSKLQDG